MLRMKRSQCVDNKQHNTSMISLLQYLFSILVILVHSGRLFSQDVIHFTFKSFLGRMAVPYFLICTAFFLRGRIQQGLCNHSYFRKLIKKYSMWTIIYLPYGYFFFESLNIAKIYLLPGFIVALLYLGMLHTLWYIPAVILGWIIIQGLLKYVGTRGDIYHSCCTLLYWSSRDLFCLCTVNKILSPDVHLYVNFSDNTKRIILHSSLSSSRIFTL